MQSQRGYGSHPHRGQVHSQHPLCVCGPLRYGIFAAGLKARSIASVCRLLRVPSSAVGLREVEHPNREGP